jgi:hypothetical protein
MLFGNSTAGMPRIWAVRGRDGKLRILNGVTRATRIAKLAPGHTVPVEVIDDDPRIVAGRMPSIGDLLP